MNKEINLVQRQADEKNIKIVSQVGEEFIQSTDENFVSVIIRNLLQNAIKYSDNASTIDIVSKDKSIVIANRSSKSNAEALNALLNNKQIDSKRSGLGLQIANDLAASLQAKIFFEQRDHNHVAAVLKWA